MPRFFYIVQFHVDMLILLYGHKTNLKHARSMHFALDVKYFFNKKQNKFFRASNDILFYEPHLQIMLFL
jgi:hypothetical protein